MPAILTETANAKINLTLRVRGRRPDQNHELESLVAFADIGDGVELVVGGRPSVQVGGPFAAAIVGSNIAARALELAAKAAPDLALGAIKIDKRLPVAAGIGGGSADAAAVLRAVRRANPGRAHAVDWHALAASLGADVPACLLSTPQFMWGTGRDTLPLGPLPHLPAVLANPGEPLSTATVFGALGAAPVVAATHPPAAPGPFADRAALIAYMRNIGNDLEPAAMKHCRAVGRVLEVLATQPGVQLARMSGSGPTCFGVFDSTAAAAAAAETVRRAQAGWWVAAVTLG